MRGVALATVLLVLTILVHEGASVSEDVYFKVLHPPEVGYIFRGSLSLGIGEDFLTEYDSVPLVLGDPYTGCLTLKNADKVAGKVVMLIRGSCSFIEKARFAERAGAIAVIIADDLLGGESELVDMVSDGLNDVTIPSLFIFGDDGEHIKSALEARSLAEARIAIPLNITEHLIPALAAEGSFPPWDLW